MRGDRKVVDMSNRGIEKKADGLGFQYDNENEIVLLLMLMSVS